MSESFTLPEHPSSAAAAASAPVERLETRDLQALIALRERRVQWMQAQGIEQWKESARPGMEARFAERLRAGAVYGIRGREGLRASVCLDDASEVWAGTTARHEDSVWYLDTLMSDPMHGKGCGGELVAAVEDGARRAGVAALRCDCRADAWPLRRFWQGRHWVPRRIETHPSGLPVLLHDRRLAPIPGSTGGASLSDAPFEETFTGAWRATLLFVVRDDRVLLIHKKRGHGAGKINGPGGKLDPGETPRACAMREVAEELCIRVSPPRFRGELRFTDTNGERIHGYVFVSDDFEGTPTETDEAIPCWFAIDDVPYGRMWADDLMWLPWVLRGEGIRGAFLTDDGRLEMAHLAFGAGPEPD